MATEKTLFERIYDGDIPSAIVYKDELCVCFKDIEPQAPVHWLLVPRKPVARLGEATADDAGLLGHLMLKAGEIARREGIDKDGYRLVINNGRDAGEAVPHLHIHILAGRPLLWPPG